MNDDLTNFDRRRIDWTKPMPREQALAILAECKEWGADEEGHQRADAVLLALLNDPEIREAYNAIDKWYA